MRPLLYPAQVEGHYSDKALTQFVRFPHICPGFECAIRNWIKNVRSATRPTPTGAD